MLMRQLILLFPIALALFCGCETVDHTGETGHLVKIDSVARLLSALPLGHEHLVEVHNAVSASSENGYDEEYMMRDLFAAPGSGVGDDEKTRAASACAYDNPLRDLIRMHLVGAAGGEPGQAGLPTRAALLTAEEYLDALERSDIQIYWPYSENWDGKTMPIVTFDPGGKDTVNVGYRMAMDPGGELHVEEVIVDEELAKTSPVWVVNRNDDSGYMSLEKLRRQDPGWTPGGGDVIVKTKATDGERIKTLVLKDFMMRRNFDPWFAGASEFFVKCGRVEDFSASTEAELKLYTPQISDFMIVVKRRQVMQKTPFNAIIVSQWTEQAESFAFMIVEDDGGTKTEWKCSAVVKIQSKSYGFEIALPFNTRDDIVWRGQLSRKYLEQYDNITSRFGDVDLTFAFF